MSIPTTIRLVLRNTVHITANIAISSTTEQQSKQQLQHDWDKIKTENGNSFRNIGHTQSATRNKTGECCVSCIQRTREK